jgi:TonB family protein
MVLEEDALQRRLAAFPQLPTLTHSNVLRPSILEYAVHPLGTVFSVRLVESSGWDAADQQAFRIVKALRFQPQDPLPPFTVPPPDLRSGRVWIHWSIAQPADNPGPGS